MKIFARTGKAFWSRPMALALLLAAYTVSLLIFPQAALAATSANLTAENNATTASADGSCVVVTYRISSQWPGGFAATITLTNKCPDPITVCWKLDFNFPANQHITQAWNATVTQSGSHVTFSSCVTIPAGGSITIGFIGTWSGSNPAPTEFYLNGVLCTTAP